MVEKNRDQIKKEFNEFAKKISRLETLRHELSALDTGDFKTDVEVIKAKLRDVNAIPEIEKEIKSLREKIEKQRSQHHTSIESQQWKKQSERIEQRIAKLNNLIKKNAKEIHVKKEKIVKNLDSNYSKKEAKLRTKKESSLDKKEFITKKRELEARIECPIYYTHVRREYNKNADRLVNSALDTNW